MQIRKANPADADKIARLHAMSWRSAYRGMLIDAYLDGDIFAERNALWAERLVHPPSNQYVAVVEAEAREALVGFVCVFGQHDPKWGALVDNIHVSPDLKRSGIGSQLIKTAEKWNLRHNNDRAMHLWVLEPNTAAQAFYLNLGAREVERSTWLAPDGSNIKQLRFAWD